MADDYLMTIDQVAEMLGMHRTFTRRFVMENLPTIDLNKSGKKPVIRVRHSAVVAYLSSITQTPRKPQMRTVKPRTGKPRKKESFHETAMRLREEALAARAAAPL